MSKLVKQTQEELKSRITAAIDCAIANGDLPEAEIPAFIIEKPADKKNGDFSTNAAMAGARAFRKAPRQIAEAIVSNLDLSGTLFERAEIAGPGFINLFLSQEYYSRIVEDVIACGDDYGRSDYGEGKKVIVEFVSANPTGPMHVGNARGAALGDGISSLLEWTGWHTEREFYINDAGNQIEKFATSLEVRYLQKCGQNVALPEDAYHGMDIVAHAEAFYAENGDKFADADSKTRRDALVAFALPKNIAGLERDLKSYRVEYDNWFSESSLHKSGAVMEIVKKLTDKGYTYEQEGAVWFKAEQFGADKDFVLVRANGIPTYIVPDIAYHCDKLVTRNFDKAINVLGADHHGYVPRLKAALKALDVDTDKLDVVLMQMVKLLRDGEPIKVSKRSGKAIGLVTLLEEIPLDAARFFFNMREADSHFEFDLDLAVEKSSQNPVYYVQYAHARICSILRTLQEEGLYQEGTPLNELPAPETSQEIELIRHLAAFPSEISAAAKIYDPSRITKYALELANLYHKFYDACSVKNAETPEIREFRTDLCRAAGQVLRNAMAILKIDCPEKM